MKFLKHTESSTQKGIAAQGAIILAVVVMVVVGAGYYVLSRQNNTPEPNIVPGTAQNIAPDGNPDTAVQAVSDQIDAEARVDEGAFEEEARSVESDSSSLSELEGSIDEANL